MSNEAKLKLEIAVKNWPVNSTSTSVELIPDPWTHPELGPLPFPWWTSHVPIPQAHKLSIEEHWFPVMIYRFQVFIDSQVIYVFQGFDPEDAETYRQVSFSPGCFIYNIADEQWEHCPFDWVPLVIAGIAVSGLITIAVRRRS